LKPLHFIVGACFSVALLAACTGGPRSSFTPLSNAPSLSLRQAAVKETVLHSFSGGATDGSTPKSGLLKVGNLLYGTSLSGGRYGKGTVFSIATTGAFTTLYSFKGGKGDGATPAAPLTNVRGTLYGTTADGGNVGSSACVNCGTVFSISTSGQEKVRYFFGSKKDDGSSPSSKLVSLGGKLYGTTSSGGIGGVTGSGTIFSVTTGGKETVLYRFTSDSDGNCTFNCYLMNLKGTRYGTAYAKDPLYIYGK